MEIENGVTVNILFFAQSKELAGRGKATICLPTKLSYKHLLDTIAINYNLQPIKNNILLAINEQVCSENRDIEIKDRDSIAVIPPLSGG